MRSGLAQAARWPRKRGKRSALHSLHWFLPALGANKCPEALCPQLLQQGLGATGPMALLAGLPLDAVDALSNGCSPEDIASLRLACSTLRSQVDQTLRHLRPTCDLGGLRALPCTWRVVSVMDLSAVDLRRVFRAQLGRAP